jgi:hypothetical protein
MGTTLTKAQDMSNDVSWAIGNLVCVFLHPFDIIFLLTTFRYYMTTRYNEWRRVWAIQRVQRTTKASSGVVLWMGTMNDEPTQEVQRTTYNEWRRVRHHNKQYDKRVRQFVDKWQMTKAQDTSNNVSWAIGMFFCLLYNILFQLLLFFKLVQPTTGDDASQLRH